MAKVRALPDGEPHPDDLEEAKHHIWVEAAERGLLPNAPPAPELKWTNLEILENWLAMGDAEEIATYILDCVSEVQKHRRNIPYTKRGVTPAVQTIINDYDGLRAQGIKKADRIKTLASSYGMSPTAVYKKLQRASIKISDLDKYG